MADETNWTAYGLVEVALEDALVGHRIPWNDVRAAALRAVERIDERMRSHEAPEAIAEAMSSYIPEVRFLTPTASITEQSDRLPGVPGQS